MTEDIEKLSKKMAAQMLGALSRDDIENARAYSLDGYIRVPIVARVTPAPAADAYNSRKNEEFARAYGAGPGRVVSGDTFRVLALLSDERVRQLKTEGFNDRHDDKHTFEDLARAAACYAMPGHFRALLVGAGGGNLRRTLWPWDESWWKPQCPGSTMHLPRHMRIHDLVKAGALIIAEIERLIRLQRREQADVCKLQRSEVVSQGRKRPTTRNASAKNRGSASKISKRKR
jgi:hypothetical protein